MQSKENKTLYTILKILILIIIFIVIACTALFIGLNLSLLFQRNVVPCPNLDLPVNGDAFVMIREYTFSCYSVLGFTVTRDNTHVVGIIGLVIVLLIVPGIITYLITRKFFKQEMVVKTFFKVLALVLVYILLAFFSYAGIYYLNDGLTYFSTIQASLQIILFLVKAFFSFILIPGIGVYLLSLLFFRRKK